MLSLSLGCQNGSRESLNMAILKVARMGHPILRKKGRALEPKEIQSDRIQRLIQDMTETMHEYRGIGLAAPQVHESLQLAIIEIESDNPRYPGSAQKPLTIFINPKITVLDQTLQGFWEGCLSVPELRGFVERPKKVQVDYLDDQGAPQSIIGEGFLATVIQHELDHLNGRLYIDRIKDPALLSYMDEYQRYHVGSGEELD